MTMFFVIMATVGMGMTAMAVLYGGYQAYLWLFRQWEFYITGKAVLKVREGDVVASVSELPTKR